MQSKFTRLVFVFILYNYLIINEAVVLFRYAVFNKTTEYENASPKFAILIPCSYFRI